MKHKLVKLKRGLYSYRAFNVKRVAGGWIIPDFDNSPFAMTHKLKEMLFVIDALERR